MKEEISEVVQEKLEIAICISLWMSIIFAKHPGKNKNRGDDERKRVN